MRGFDAVRVVLVRHKLNLCVASKPRRRCRRRRILILSFERGVEGSNIASLPDAIWWAITTVTTVG